MNEYELNEHRELVECGICGAEHWVLDGEDEVECPYCGAKGKIEED
jgi:DNA-directed RNA polymerase subunit RPC12/RpoP